MCMKMEESLYDDKEMETMDKGKSKNKGEKKMMTMEDVAECLSEDFPDEISDSKKYMHMAKIADAAGDEQSCHYLMEMSKDEYTHARFIRHFMHLHDMDIPEDQEHCYKELEEKMAEFF